MNESIVLSSTDAERLIALEKQPDGLARAVRYIEDKIAEGVAAGRFTEAAARADFGSAGVLARYLLCMNDYVKSAEALRVILAAKPASAEEDGSVNAALRSVWNTIAAHAYVRCGRTAEASRHAEMAVHEAPEMPWGWFWAAALRAHALQKAAALDAVRRGLALLPGNAVFAAMKRAIEADAGLIAMVQCRTDPNAPLGPQAAILERRPDLACVLLDQAGFEAVTGYLASDAFESADPPDIVYTTVVSSIAGPRLTWRFLMNAAGLSHLNRPWLESAARAVPKLLASLDRTPEALESVLVFPDGRLGLRFKDDLEALNRVLDPAALEAAALREAATGELRGLRIFALEGDVLCGKPFEPFFAPSFDSSVEPAFDAGAESPQGASGDKFVRELFRNAVWQGGPLDDGAPDEASNAGSAGPSAGAPAKNLCTLEMHEAREHHAAHAMDETGGTEPALELDQSASGSSAEPETLPDDEPGLLALFERWSERGDFRLIISTIESLPADRRTDAVLGELARAYNNLAQPGEDALFLRALDILQLTAESGEEDHLWHFRAGYALFHLDRLGEALQEFERALQLRPGDEDTMRFIAASQAGVTMPRFRVPFRRRVADAWRSFAAKAPEIRRDLEAGRTEVARFKAEEALRPAAAGWDIALTPPDADGRCGLILSANGQRAFVPAILFFAGKMPPVLGEAWRVHAGRVAGGVPLDAEAALFEGAQFRLEREESGGVRIYCYSPIFEGIDTGEAVELFTSLSKRINDVIGEAAAFRWLLGFTIVRRRPAEPGGAVPFEGLAERFFELIPQARDFTMTALAETRLDFWLKPDPDPDADLYWDIGQGWTTCTDFLNAYRMIDNGVVDALERIGAAAGFFYFEGFEALEPDARREAAAAFLDSLAAHLRESVPDACCVFGEATGLYRFYLDCCIWDFPAAANAVLAFADKNPAIASVSWHTYRRVAGSVILKERVKREGTGEAAEAAEAQDSSAGSAESDEAAAADHAAASPEAAAGDDAPETGKA